MTTKKESKANLLALAFRNLSRHRVKTVITVTAVAFGIVAYLYMDGFIAGVNTESRRNLVNYEMGASTIFSKAYWEKKDEYPLYEGFSDYTRLQEILDRAGYATAPRAVFVGSLISQEEELPFVFHGVDPASEKQMFLYHEYIEKEEGAHFIQDGVFEILLGVKGAKDLGVKAGDTVRLSTVIDKRDDRGTLRHINQVIDLVVAGVLNTPDPIVNSYVGYLPLSILQDELGLLLEGNITELLVRKAGAREDELPGRFEEPEAVARTLGPALPEPLTIVGWRERAADYLAASASDVIQSVVFLGFFFVVVFMVIANTVLMAVLERTREIGMLRALGMSDRSIMISFFFETALIGFLGALVGILLFLPLNYFMVEYGIDYTQMMEESGINNFGYRVTGVFKSAWNFSTMGLSVVGATLLSSLAAFFPSRRAVRMVITDALRMD